MAASAAQHLAAQRGAAQHRAQPAAQHTQRSTRSAALCTRRSAKACTQATTGDLDSDRARAPEAVRCSAADAQLRRPQVRSQRNELLVDQLDPLCCVHEAGASAERSTLLRLEACAGANGAQPAPRTLPLNARVRAPAADRPATGHTLQRGCEPRSARSRSVLRAPQRVSACARAWKSEPLSRLNDRYASSSSCSGAASSTATATVCCSGPYAGAGAAALPLPAPVGCAPVGCASTRAAYSCSSASSTARLMLRRARRRYRNARLTTRAAPRDARRVIIRHGAASSPTGCGKERCAVPWHVVVRPDVCVRRTPRMVGSHARSLEPRLQAHHRFTPSRSSNALFCRCDFAGNDASSGRTQAAKTVCAAREGDTQQQRQRCMQITHTALVLYRVKGFAIS